MSKLTPENRAMLIDTIKVMAKDLLGANPEAFAKISDEHLVELDFRLVIAADMVTGRDREWDS